jgi:pimeloyl-ACP methyl ester carboxylesterase
MSDTISDGIRIAYDDLGQGEPALVCLPGWCADKSAFAPLAPRLARGRRVLALDWRGHGGSAAAPADFDFDALVRDALAVVAASGARRVVPLATAHAGWVAIALRERLGAERVPALVLVDWIVTAAPPPFLAGLAALQDPNAWQAARDRLFAMWLHGVDDAGVVRFVREGMAAHGFDMWSRGGRAIAAAYARDGSPLAALARLAPPTLHVYAQPADPGYLAAQQAFAAANPWFQVEQIAARSHFPTIEAPDAIAAAVDRFISE